MYTKYKEDTEKLSTCLYQEIIAAALQKMNESSAVSILVLINKKYQISFTLPCRQAGRFYYPKRIMNKTQEQNLSSNVFLVILGKGLQ